MMLTKKVSKIFSSLLLKEVGPIALDSIIAVNRYRSKSKADLSLSSMWDTQDCASHAHIYANGIMQSAFYFVFNKPANGHDPDDMFNWNEAWKLAVINDFYNDTKLDIELFEKAEHQCDCDIKVLFDHGCKCS